VSRNANRRWEKNILAQEQIGANQHSSGGTSTEDLASSNCDCIAGSTGGCALARNQRGRFTQSMTMTNKPTTSLGRWAILINRRSHRCRHPAGFRHEEFAGCISTTGPEVHFTKHWCRPSRCLTFGRLEPWTATRPSICSIRTRNSNVVWYENPPGRESKPSVEKGLRSDYFLSVRNLFVSVVLNFGNVCVR